MTYTPSSEDKHVEPARQCDELRDQVRALEEYIERVNAEILQAQMSNMELEQIFSACLDPMLVIRDDGVVVRANRKMLELLNKPLEQVVGANCCDLLTKKECHLASTTQKTSQTDIDLVDSDGNSVSFIMTTSKLITLDGSDGTLAQYKDITERKNAARALAQAHAAMEHLARTDGLTQIPNRRTFDKSLQLQWHSHLEQQNSLAIILCDIDFFKKYNDTYGHQAGDTCLVKVAAALQRALPNDEAMVARYGGEEFIFLLPDTNRDAALTCAEKARANVEQLGIEHSASDVSSVVTLSLGVASAIPTSTTTAAALLKAADDALYRAKENGRNRVIAAE